MGSMCLLVCLMFRTEEAEKAATTPRRGREEFFHQRVCRRNFLDCLCHVHINSVDGCVNAGSPEFVQCRAYFAYPVLASSKSGLPSFAPPTGAAENHPAAE